MRKYDIKGLLNFYEKNQKNLISSQTSSNEQYISVEMSKSKIEKMTFEFKKDPATGDVMIMTHFPREIIQKLAKK